MTGLEIDNEIDQNLQRMKNSASHLLSICDADAEAAITAGLGAVLIIAHGLAPADRTIGDIIESLKRYHAQIVPVGGKRTLAELADVS